MLSAETRNAASAPLPYFRTAAFSELLLRCERMLLELLNAEPGWRVLVLTASGTAAMEATITAAFAPTDPLLVLNGGGFGERFAEICRFHGRNFEELRVAPGKDVPAGAFDKFRKRGLRGFLVNHHETTTGQLYDLKALGRFARENGLSLVVDAVSSFPADPIDVSRDLAKGGVDAILLSSQKGFALHPGLSLVAVSPRLAERIERNEAASYYLDLKRYLRDGARGQTPFTPAVGVILQLEKALIALQKKGLEKHTRAVGRIARDFRQKIAGLPFAAFAQTPSNAVTALAPTDGRSAARYVERLREDYGYYVCPNGAPFADSLFRVGHLGALTTTDNSNLARALAKLARAKHNRRLAA